VDKADKDDQANVIQSMAAEIETIRASSGDKKNNEPNVVEAERQTDLQSKAWDDMLARFAELETDHERVKAELSRSCPRKANAMPKYMTEQGTDEENVKEIRHCNLANEELATEITNMAENTSCLQENAAHGVMAVDNDERVEKNICLEEAKERLHEANDQLATENKDLTEKIRCLEGAKVKLDEANGHFTTKSKGMAEKIRCLEVAKEDLKEDIRYYKMKIQDLKEQVQMRKEEIEELRDETGKTNVATIQSE
jgi:chromosome segregation ATPase